MAKRKLDTSRLYKLTKWIVIVISVVSGLLALNAYYRISNNKLLNSYAEICKDQVDLRPEVNWSSTECMLGGFEHLREVQDNILILLTIAIGLPILFFGSVALARYLFPKKK